MCLWSPPMPCRVCACDNPPRAKYCIECGTPIAPRDGATLPYTPRHLVEKTLGSRAALEGERKLVTVLFADVKDSMGLAEQLDPEEWHRLLDRFFHILADGVHRFEGTVNQYTGDGIMALFGAPVAHEDHAERACWAALHLRDEVRRYADELRTSHGLSFAVRMGLNSGEVVVGRIGDDLRMDYTAQGHTVGLAQRMEQLAEPGRPLLTEHTARLVTGRFALRDLGSSRVKGATEALRLFELEGPGRLRTRLDVSRTRGLSRFVGRDAELAILESELDEAMAGRGRLIAIVAEPGVGKSRLCYEFAARCRARGIDVAEAHGLAHGRNIPLRPWMELMRGIFGITAEDGPDMARQKIAGRLLLADRALHDALPSMFDFLGVPDPAAARSARTPETIRRDLHRVVGALQQARARAREFRVILLEDLHWFDRVSEAICVEVLAGAVTSPTLVLTTFRPEYDATPLARWDYRRLALEPLRGDALTELVRGLLGPDASVARLAERLSERTGGNPFFVEEVVQALIETGALSGSAGAYRLATPVEDVAIPPSVQAVLAARIDRLAERDKGLLQTAAVIGRRCSAPVLRRVAGLPGDELAAAAQSLVAAEFLHEVALFPAVEYAFKHPLTQEVAYRSQLGERRARIHAEVARAVEELHADDLDERAALLAYHWEGAGDAGRAAEWHARAADWIGSRDRSERVRHWRQVRRLLSGVAESPRALGLAVLACRNVIYGSYTLGEGQDDAPAVFAEAMALAERLGEPGACVRLLTSYGIARLSLGEIDDGIAHLREALRLAERTGNAFLRFIARMPLVAALNTAGPLDEALRLADDAEPLGRDAPELAAEVGASPFGFLLAHRTAVLAQLGRFDDAARTAASAMALAGRQADREVLGIAHSALAAMYLLAGAPERAIADARAATEHADAAGTTLSQSLARGTLGRAELANGRFERAAELLDGTLALMRERRTALYIEGLTVSLLAEAYVGTGDRERARAALASAVDVGRRRRAPVYDIPALLGRARVTLALDGAAAATEVETMLREAAAGVAATRAQAYAPFIEAERIRLSELRRGR